MSRSIDIFQSFGGQCAARLAAYDLRFNDPAASGALRARAAELGVEPLDDVAGIACADVVLSLVVGAATKAVAAEAVFIDLNSVGPDTKALAAGAIATGKGSFVEGAVMARVPPYAEKVPILVAGRRAVEVAERLNALGMNLEAVGETPGQASSLKMIRSVMIKGVEALLIEALSSAERAGVTERILDSVQETFPGLDWRDVADYYLSRTFEHGARRVTEMTEAAETIESFGLNAPMSRAACETIAAAHAAMKDQGLSVNDGYRGFVPVLARRLARDS
ncbi:NAD(P)-dependent oxidoreductase [Sinorhizobium meliloti]|nr:NAD(P)-dependent oxidoreductase [Sinorhizobium meliloti]